MTWPKLDTVLFCGLKSNGSQTVSWRRSYGQFGLKARLAAALLAMAIGVACGGGGGSLSGGAQVTAQVSSGSLTFATQGVSTTSAAQTLTVTNSGILDLTVSSVVIGGTNAGDFAKAADTCTGAAVLPNTSCRVSVTFTPLATGSRSASLTFSDNAPTSPQTVSLNGTAIGPTVGFSSPNLSFSNLPVNAPSAAQVETVTNTGSANLIISAVALGGTNAGDFAKSTDTCTGATVTPNSTCAVGIQFTPAAPGALSATLSFTDNGDNSPQVVNLSGTGEGPEAVLSSTSLSFGNVAQFASSAAQTETVTNTGNLNLTISTVTVGGTNPGDFTKSTDTCTGSTVTPNSTCTVSIIFTPSLPGSRSAALNFNDNGPGNPQSVTLGGTGLGPGVSFSAPNLGFSYQLLSTQSSPLTETVTSNGTTNVTVTTVKLGGTNAGDFAKSADTCTGATLIPNSTCAVTMTFTPSGLGIRSASLSFADNVSTSPQVIGVSGTGALPVVSLSAAIMTFSSQVVNTTSLAQSEIVTNTSPVPLIISTLTIGGTNAGDFAMGADSCTGATLAPNATCAVSVTFTPAATGARSATLSIVDNAANSPQTSSLTGTGGTQLTGVYTQRYDNTRSGQNIQETTLTPSNVAVGQFGKLFSLPVDGQVYAQPLYVQNVTIPSQGSHNVVFVATQHDSVYAFDADGLTTTPLWQVSFLNSAAGVTSVPSADVYPGIFTDINPEVGITSTPVIDPGTGTLYVTAKTREPLGSVPCTSNGSYEYCYRLHALDITTGAEKFGGPVIIAASVPGTGYDNVGGTVTFGALRHLQRPGLLLLNGNVYIGFGSHGDNDPYHGWLMAYNATTLQQVAVLNITPNGEEGAIWQGGGGISADEAGYVYVVTSNGTFDVNKGGIDYGESVLKLQVQSGQFQIVDYFTPFNQAILTKDDLDLGSSPALILPDQPGTNPHLLVMGGKDGRVWVLNRDNLGHLQANDAGALQIIPGLSDELIDGVSYWNGNLYLQEIGDYLYQFPLQNGVAQTAVPSTDEFGGYPDDVAVITSNGTSNAVLWFLLTTGYGSGGPGILYAFDANNIANQLYNSNLAAYGVDRAGMPVKFAIPTVANGKVYVGGAAQIDVYGLLP